MYGFWVEMRYTGLEGNSVFFEHYVSCRAVNGFGFLLAQRQCFCQRMIYYLFPFSVL